MKNWKYLLLLLTTALVQTSCLTGMGEDFVARVEVPVDEALKVIASRTVIYANGEDEVFFTVKFREQELSADEVTFHNAADNSAIALEVREDGSIVYTTQQVGTFGLYARYISEEGESNSPSISIRAISEVSLEDRSGEYTADQKGNECLELTPSTGVFQAGKGRAVLVARYKGKVLNASEFQVYNKETGAKLDLQTGTFMENGVSYTLPIFASEEAQTISLWIQHKVYQTADNPSTITVVDFPVPSRPVDDNPGKTNFHHRALLTKFTGAGCGFCPAMSAPLHDLYADETLNFADKAVLAEAHTFQSTHPLYPGPINDAFNVKNHPTVVVDFLAPLANYGYESNMQNIQLYVDRSLETPAKAGIAAGMALEGNQLIVRVSVKAAETNTFRVGAWLCENGLYATQTNYPESGISSSDYDLNTHDNVIRIADSYNSNSDCSGHDLNDGNPIAAGEMADYLFMMNLQEGWKLENCHLVLFVTAPYASGYTVTNVVRTESLTQAIDFEYAD